MIQKQYSFYISSKYFKIILLIFFAIISSKLSLGQGLILERAESNVLVKLNNLVKAKQDALKDAKIQVILQAVSRFLDFESMISLKPILEKYFLEKPDYFIESVRIIKEGNTKDFSEFRIKIETQIFRSRILSTFRKLGLPISKELLTIKNVILIYNVNNELRKKRLFVEILNNLQKRLNPYRIKTKFVNNKIKFFPITSGLSDRLVFLKNKNLTENNGDTLNLLELNIKLLPKISESNKRILKAQLIYWPHNNAIQTKDESSINVKVNLNYSKWGKEKIITEILDSLMISWAPIIKKIREANKGKGQKLFLKFIGVQGPIEEQILFKTLFQNNPNWKDIFLNKISTNSVSYEGVFLGKKNKIFKNINILNLPFKISNSFWRENQVIIDTSWKEIFSNLERYQESTSENILTEIYSNEGKKIDPIFSVPLSTFKGTYNLPLASPVLDNIRHRGDSTLFKLFWPKKNTSNGEKNILKITWHRIGPTNLSPKITLFNQNKHPIKSFLLGRKKEIYIEQELKTDDNVYFLRISDEIGFLEDVAGSYQSFRYIITVKKAKLS